MGTEDVRRQKLNVFRMELLGTRVVPVDTGQKTLKDAINAAMRDWLATSDHTHYVIGSVMGPHPYPRRRGSHAMLTGSRFLLRQTRVSWMSGVL